MLSAIVMGLYELHLTTVYLLFWMSFLNDGFDR